MGPGMGGASEMPMPPPPPPPPPMAGKFEVSLQHFQQMGSCVTVTITLDNR